MQFNVLIFVQAAGETVQGCQVSFPDYFSKPAGAQQVNVSERLVLFDKFRVSTPDVFVGR